MTSHLNFKVLGRGGSFLDEYFLVCKIAACFEIYQKSYYNLVQFNAELIIILQKVSTYLVKIKVLVDLSSEAYFWFSQ